jgi:prolyl-tRNA synthetase
MGCYGIGLTRLMAATVEILTPKEANDIRWPRRIVPYQVAILPPKVRYYFIRLENIIRQSLPFLER